MIVQPGSAFLMTGSRRRQLILAFLSVLVVPSGGGGAEATREGSDDCPSWQCFPNDKGKKTAADCGIFDCASCSFWWWRCRGHKGGQ